MRIVVRFSACTILCAHALLLPAQSNEPFAAPGLKVPSRALPYALDQYEGKPELVPVHRSTIEVNQHKGANVAGSLAGSFFYKPKMTTELAGAHARTALHDSKPAIYLRRMEEDPDGQGGDGGVTWTMVRASVDGERRILAKILFTQLTGNAKRKDGVVETKLETLPGGWLKLTPAEALAPGEYAVMPVPHAQNAYSTVVYDFSLNPAAPNASDAVQAKEHAE